MHEKITKFKDDLISITFKNGRIFGKDQYNKYDLEYPECYAKFLIAIFYQYKIKKECYIKEQVKHYINYMLSLANETEEYVYWGLPYDWGKTKIDDGFLITTAFCLKSLYLWYTEDIFTEKEIIKKSINWCMSLYHEDCENGLYYSSKLKQNIYNATSIACGILAMTKEFMTHEEIKRLDNIMLALAKAQKKGYWNYSLNKEDVDLLHQCYTCEGMFEYSYVVKNEIVLNAAIKGVDFLIKNKNFLINERYLFNLSDDEKLKIQFKHTLLKTYLKLKDDEIRYPKTRAWSYAAYIRTLILGYVFTKNLNYIFNLEEVIDFINHYILNGNKVLFKLGTRETYVRNTYHMLEALCFYDYFNMIGEVI